MTLSDAMRASARGLNAERLRLELTSTNIANANSMTTPFEEAYRRRVAVLTGSADGPKVTSIAADPSQLRAVNDPFHPYADAQGNIYFSNVQPVREMVDMMSAQRAYEANIAAFNSAKGMEKAALAIGRA